MATKKEREAQLKLSIPWFVEVVTKELTHEHYDRVTELAHDYRAYITGDGLNDMMRRFTMRETKAAFAQRILITQHIIPSVVSNIISVERKVPRSNGKRRVLVYKDDTGLKKAKELQEILDQYWGTMSLDDWMATRWIELNDVDPNTFVVVEWDTFDGNKEKALPYPYESSADDAVMFEYINNILQYLIDLKEFSTKDWDGKPTQADKYTMYLMNQTIMAVQIFDKGIRSQVLEDGKIFDIDGILYFRRNNRDFFRIDILTPHNLGFVPAFRAGYKRDEFTNGLTFVSPYNDCVPYLQKTIKANSELDLTMALHAFPQKIVTSRKCTGKDCSEGTIYHEGNKKQCDVCKGSGFAVHSSTQDIIFVPLPRGKEEQLSLDNLVQYVTPEVALLEFQRLYIEYLTNECMQAVFNSDIFTREDIATTATEKTIDLDNIYDTLFPFAIAFGRAWEFQVDTIAEVTDLDDDLVVSLTFSKDFKFKSKADYINERKAALDAGTPDAILRNIDDEIMKIDTSDNPVEFEVYRTVQSFDPFSGKTDEEIITALASNTVPFEIKVLYNNLGWIFDKIFLENPEFFNFNYAKQAEIVKAAVDAIVEELKTESTVRAEFTDENG